MLYDYAEKANQRPAESIKQFGGNQHFSEITGLHCGKTSAIHCYGCLSFTSFTCKGL